LFISLLHKRIKKTSLGGASVWEELPPGRSLRLGGASAWEEPSPKQ